MDIWKVAAIGLAAVFLGIFIKQTKPEYSMLLIVGSGLLILYYGAGKITYLAQSVKELQSLVSIDPVYLKILWKMICITYVGQFTSAICKDAGYSAVASQIELFGKLSILVISMPVLLALLKTVQEFLS
ncbi:MAG: SpoIIIAC/SpoIIIAD family protein [Lachnospiraceae bacterium]|jgi:stage III sporulation protein AD|nr:SpoIIIAC/SpoIIIAD family protein [Lachnospiraceae bacterium]MDD3615167.1 SpoIIIAC/SpoIIIAD family protein [Lachnospiraceae bacterium]